MGDRGSIPRRGDADPFCVYPYFRISTIPRTGVAFHYGITSDPLRINFISPYSNKDWSKFDPRSAIDQILFELVEREFKDVYVLKNCSSSY